MPGRRTPAVGEYLARIFTMLREGNRVVGARLAQRLGVSPPAVTQALQRMSRDGLVTLDPELGVQLTPQGMDRAASIIRRHYLIERLLVDRLGFDWADADEEAERLEHALSQTLEEYLDQTLGHPTTCPHGNPFPGSPDEERLIWARSLAQAGSGERVTVLRVTEEGEEDMGLMRLLLKEGMVPGASVHVTSVDPGSGSVSVAAPGGAATIPASQARMVRISEPLPHA